MRAARVVHVHVLGLGHVHVLVLVLGLVLGGLGPLGGVPTLLTPAAHATPSPDRAAALVAVPARASTRDLCAVQRTAFFDGTATVDLTYARDGRVTRRERWAIRVGKPAVLAHAEDIAWSGRERTITARVGPDAGTRRARFDERGLLVGEQIAYADRKRAGGTVELVWELQALPRAAAWRRPTSTDPATHDLPWQLGYTGVVQITRRGFGAGTQGDTAVYDQHGTRLQHGCRHDDRGRETTCGSGDAIKRLTWTDGALTGWVSETTFERPRRILTRDRYRYDATHRVVRAERAREGTGGGLALAWLSLVEYRCAGIEAYREPDSLLHP